MLKALSTIFLVFIAFGLSAQEMTGTSYLDNWMKPDGPVSAMVKHGNNIYIAGQFTHLRYPKPNGASLDLTDGHADTNFLAPNGIVEAVVSDGNGGWFIGGGFTRVGGEARNYLARLNADGSLNPWNPGADDVVYSLLLSGTNLYIGGAFDSLGGQERRCLGSIDINTAQPATWNPQISTSFSYKTIQSMAILGNELYIGGVFDTVGGLHRKHIAAIDLTSGLPTAFNPGANGSIFAMQPAGNKLYIGGAFTEVGGVLRNYVACLNVSTGLPTSFDPSASNYVHSLALSGNKLYLGGTFGQVSGQTRYFLAAVNTSNGQLTPWSPYVSIGTGIYSILLSGTTLYIVGNFQQVESDGRSNAAAISTVSGNTLAWNPNASQTILVLASDGTSIYSGGYFASIGGYDRPGLAAINVNTGLLTSWNPGPVVNGGISSMAAANNTIYVGGHFDELGGLPRENLGAIDATTGAVLSGTPPVTGSIRTLVADSNIVYLGGDFSAVSAQTRNNLAAFDIASGQPTSWNPNANDEVYTICLSAGGDTVFTGGQFTNVGGSQRSRVAALSAITGAATTWNPGANGKVTSLLRKGNTLYLGGHFNNLGGQVRPTLAAVDAVTGTVTPWQAIKPTIYIDRLALSRNTLYVTANLDFPVAGFNTVTGLPIAEITPTGGLNPYPVSILTMGDTIVMAGDFSLSNSLDREFFIPIIDSFNQFSTQIAASDSSICPGADVTYSVVYTDTTLNPAYQWYRNGAAIPFATSNFYIDTALVDMDTITLVATSTLPGFTSDTSHPLIVGIDSAIVWTGAANNSLWSDPLNWTCGVVPGPTNNVQIPFNMGVIIIDTPNATCLNLTLSGLSLLSFSGTAPVLHVFGTFTNKGTVDVAGGTLIVDIP